MLDLIIPEADPSSSGSNLSAPDSFDSLCAASFSRGPVRSIFQHVTHFICYHLTGNYGWDFSLVYLECFEESMRAKPPLPPALTCSRVGPIAGRSSPRPLVALGRAIDALAWAAISHLQHETHSQQLHTASILHRCSIASSQQRQFNPRTHHQQ
jgi:hypothetical protein